MESLLGTVGIDVTKEGVKTGKKLTELAKVSAWSYRVRVKAKVRHGGVMVRALDSQPRGRSAFR